MINQARRDFIRRFSYAALGAVALPSLAYTRYQSAGGSGSAEGFEPAYLKLHRSGELKQRAKALNAMMASCSLCPRECGVNRLQGQRGICGSTSEVRVSSFNPHFGEERPLVGENGSGTVFFSNCSLLCVFCINWQISHDGQGADHSTKRLAQMMLTLQKAGCHNINVVTPTHYSPQIVEALDMAAASGLRLPVAYNTCGWEKMEIMQLLDGIIDIYLTDFKYTDPDMAAKYSAGASSYPEVTMRAIEEMNRQVGVALPGSDGLINRGLIIRHLVMPNDIGGSTQAMEWIAQELPSNTYVNIMSQYRPMHKAFDYPDIARRITVDEYTTVVEAARRAGLTNLDVQGGV